MANKALWVLELRTGTGIKVWKSCGAVAFETRKAAVAERREWAPDNLSRGDFRIVKFVPEECRSGRR